MFGRPRLATYAATNRAATHDERAWSSRQVARGGRPGSLSHSVPGFQPSPHIFQWLRCTAQVKAQASRSVSRQGHSGEEQQAHACQTCQETGRQQFVNRPNSTWAQSSDRGLIDRHSLCSLRVGNLPTKRHGTEDSSTAAVTSSRHLPTKDIFVHRQFHNTSTNGRVTYICRNLAPGKSTFARCRPALSGHPRTDSVAEAQDKISDASQSIRSAHDSR